MRKCVLGNGYIGSAFKNAGYECIDRQQFDVQKNAFPALEYLIQKFDVIVNCIGITDTKWSEHKENFWDVWQINVLFVKQLSDYCAKHNKKLVHISTGDLYGNNFEWEKNTEEKQNLDVSTTYRLSKLVSEKMCNDEALILRIRLPFDEREHPKNLLVKAPPYRKFYPWLNTFTYVPDLISATHILLEQNKSGLYNVVQNNNASVFTLMREVSPDTFYQSIDPHDKENPNLIWEMNNVHIHNDINATKLREVFIQTDIFAAWKCSWETYHKQKLK